LCRDSLLLFFQVGIDVVDVDDVLVTMLDDVLTTEAFVETTADDVADEVVVHVEVACPWPNTDD